MNSTKLYHVVDLDVLTQAILERHVRAQDHPSEPLRILNYTELCAVTPGAWNRTTLACRGLIYQPGTLEVVARGFDKFFNYGQPGAAVIDLDASVLVSDKMDGSLGIIYPLPSGGWAVATRGSFTSEQAAHATELLRTRYPGFTAPAGVTTLVEIIYPGNRIVLDYAGLDDLVLLGGVAHRGGVIPPASMQMISGWPGPVAQTMEAFTLAEALALPPRPNAEGVVVLDVTRHRMVKIKQDDYVTLHKIITGLTARKVWEHVCSQRPVTQLLEQLPDEFHDWVCATAGGIEDAVAKEHGRLLADFYKAIDAMPDGWVDEFHLPASGEVRKQFALVVADSPDRWAMFALLDGRDITGELYKRAKPDAFLTPYGRAQSEETA